MGLMYYPAEGCQFKPTPRKSLFAKHLDSKLRCACKNQAWTLEDAVRGQVDGRSARFQNRQSAGDTVINYTTIDNSTHNTTIHLHLPAILPSGSAITAGLKKPEVSSSCPSCFPYS